MVLIWSASGYETSAASAANTEFRELLTQELERVDDRFFEVHDSSQEEIEELDAMVHHVLFNSNDSGITVLPRKNKMNGKHFLDRESNYLRRKKCLRVTRTLEDLLGNEINVVRLSCRIHSNKCRGIQENPQKV
jgi:hypothetical protein